MKIQEYWAKVHAKQSTLPDEVMIISVETKTTKPGSVVAVASDIAAQRLVDGTHQIATAEEVAEFNKRTAAKLAGDRERELRRMPIQRLVGVVEEPGTGRRTLAQPTGK